MPRNVSFGDRIVLKVSNLDNEKNFAAGLIDYDIFGTENCSVQDLTELHMCKQPRVTKSFVCQLDKYYLGVRALLNTLMDEDKFNYIKEKLT